MAGLGYISWVEGQLVSQQYFQGYLQDQVIMTFADATARDAASTEEVPSVPAGRD